VPVFAVDDDGREGGKHDGAAGRRAQQATPRTENQNGSRVSSSDPVTKWNQRVSD